MFQNSEQHVKSSKVGQKKPGLFKELQLGLAKAWSIRQQIEQGTTGDPMSRDQITVDPINHIEHLYWMPRPRWRTREWQSQVSL